MRRFLLTFAVAALALGAGAASCSGESGNTAAPVIVNPGDSENTGGDDTPTSGDTPSVGKTIPAWVKGNLDIHFINTTHGECTFIILPDGTQILVDAAGAEQATGTVGSTTNVGIRSRWDPTKESGFDCAAFIMEYIDKCMEWTGNKTIDYVVDTHFHNDHYGAHLTKPVSTKSSTYRLQTLVKILESYPIGKLMDRGWPDYDYPFNMMKYYKATSESSVYNWITAVKWLNANNNLNVEKFSAGSNTQMALKYDASTFSNCRIQNLSVNGDVWTGVGTGYTATFPELSKIVCASPPSVANGDCCPEENHESCTFKVSYGAFDYFAGGDLQYDGMSSYSWKDIETVVAKACGVVDVMKADHHGVSNTNGYGYKDKAWAMKHLSPTCWIVNSWTDGHPRQTTFEGVTGYLPNLNVFITNSCSSQEAYANYSKCVKGRDGHIVVRVSNGGAKYSVYTLTDSDRKMTIKSISGPYTSR